LHGKTSLKCLYSIQISNKRSKNSFWHTRQGADTKLLFCALIQVAIQSTYDWAPSTISERSLSKKEVWLIRPRQWWLVPINTIDMLCKCLLNKFSESVPLISYDHPLEDCTKYDDQ
jgi:hypothetical protein